MKTPKPYSRKKGPLFRAAAWLGLGLAAAIVLPLVSQANETPAAAAAPPEDAPLDVQIKLNQDKLVRGEDQEVVIKIDLVAGKPKSGGKRLPLNIAVVLDRSGSMDGGKLEQAKQAASMLVDRLESDDVFSLVTYDTEVEVNIPATKVGDNSERWRRQISKIETGGSTALYAGVESGGEQVREFLKDNRINRVILLSDGLANVGKKSNSEIAKLGRDLAKDGIGVTTIGLGADFNEDLMTALAEASDANYYYVEDVEKLPEVFAKELGQLNNIVARDVEIRIILPEGVTPIGIMGRNEKFEGQEAVLKLSHFNANQRREILVQARLKPGQEASATLANVNTRYRNELADGSEGTLDRQAQVVVTESRSEAESSRNDDVVVRQLQMETDEAKTDAANLAAEGNRDEAERVLEKQRHRNMAAAEALPAPSAAAVASENTALDTYGDSFANESGAALSDSVKRAKEESWNRAQSK